MRPACCTLPASPGAVKYSPTPGCTSVVIATAATATVAPAASARCAVQPSSGRSAADEHHDRHREQRGDHGREVLDRRPLAAHELHQQHPHDAERHDRDTGLADEAGAQPPGDTDGDQGGDGERHVRRIVAEPVLDARGEDLVELRAGVGSVPEEVVEGEQVVARSSER